LPRAETYFVIDKDTLQTCQERIGYTFHDPELLSLSLTHSSVAPTRLESNERLEFLGDAVLGLVICEELYRRCPDRLEGELTRAKSYIVSRQTCARMAEDLEIPELMHLGKGMAEPAGLPQSVLGAVLESLIGAVYLDGGLEPARELILRAAEPYLRRALDEGHHQNFKSILQQHAQRRWGTTPEYHLLDEKGPDHSKCFEVAVTINGRNFSSAWGTNKKDAEQAAAREALFEMDLLEEPS
jgi:ribonuclease-3